MLTQPVSVETNLAGRIVTSNVIETSTTIYARFEDLKTGEAREPNANTKLFVLSKDQEEFEMILADSHTTTDGVTTIIVNASGRNLQKYGNLVGSATGNKHPINREIGCAETHIPNEILNQIIRGSEGTGATSFKVGNETNADITYYAWNADGNRPFLRYVAADNKWVFSNDGVSTSNIGGSTATFTAGDGLDLTGGVFSVAGAAQVSATDNTAGYLDDKVTVSGTNITKTIVNPGVNETINLEVSVDSTPVDTAYTAQEDIAIGHPVSKTDIDDEVENTIISTLATAGTESTFSATANYLKSCYCADDKVAILYADATKTYLVIGTVSLDKTVSYGTPVEIVASATAAIALKYMEDNKVVFCYRKTADDKLYANVATVVDTTITTGTEKEVSNMNATGQFVDVAIIDTDKIIVAYRDTSASNKGYVRCATVSGTTIGTFGTAVEFLTTGAGNAVTDIAITKCSTDKAIVFCQNVTDTNKGKGVLVIATGTALAVATEVEIDANASSSFSADYITDGKVLVTWVGGASTYVQARVASISGLNLTYPTAVTAVNSLAALTPSVANIDDTTAFIAYEESATSDGKFNKISISGTTLTVGSQNVMNGTTNNLSGTSISKVNNKNKILISYKDEADSNKGNAEVFQEYDNSASLVGFATDTVSATETVNARSKGVIGSQTCVAGTTYYLASNGISSTNTYGIKVGIGKSADELDIDIDRDNGLSLEDATTLSNGSNADDLHKHKTRYSWGDEGQVNINATQFLPISGSASNGSTESVFQMVIPEAGVIKNIYSKPKANTFDGAATTLFFRVNGSDSPAGAVGTWVAGNTASQLYTSNISVAAGDLVTLKIVTTNTGAGNIKLCGTLEYQPT